ncbi:MAG: molybdate ABC transporter substrate-binding protein [Ilumatobacteraceae bacterium]
MRVAMLSVAVLLMSGCAPRGAAKPDAYIAAASDTRDAFTELAADLSSSAGVEVEFVFGSSGLLREQVLNGAPYDVYVSANGEFVNEIVNAGFARPENVREYARGVVALIARDQLALPPAPTSGDESASSSSIIEVLGDAGRIAIANPAHAPYGVAAKEMLQSLGIYEGVANRLILAENVADAVRIVEAGEADYGLVALALVRSREHRAIDTSLYQPIRQTAALTRRGEENRAARAFYDALVSPEGVALLRKYGFVVEAQE